jgi:hypothetical protein
MSGASAFGAKPKLCAPTGLSRTWSMMACITEPDQNCENNPMQSRDLAVANLRKEISAALGGHVQQTP